jgi:tetratricopeptide (TPR) repeat protein
VNAIGKEFRLNRWALGLVLAGVACALAGLWWTSNRADVNFLPAMPPAEWIVFPPTPEMDVHHRVELPAKFGTTFALGRVPEKALLRIAGFHRYTLAINGTTPGRPERTGTSWKRPDVFEVAGLLHPGTNRIEVTVFNSNGPPALWLALDAGGTQVNSGRQWQVSIAGSNWRTAVPVSAPKQMPSGSESYGLPVPWVSLGTHWPTLLIFTLLSAAGCWLLRKKAVRAHLSIDGEAGKNACATAFVRIAWDRLRGALPVAVLAVLWVGLFANNLAVLPRLTGFDSIGHLDYIRYIAEHHSLPLAGQGWEMFQPPLYYLLSAAWLGMLHLSVSDAGGLVALRILGLAIGVAHFAIVWSTLRLLFPAERSKAIWGVVLAAFLPPLLYLSQSVTNEAFAAMMISACVWLALRAMKQESLPWMSCVWLGLCLGGALLAKSTALLVLPPILGGLLWRWLEEYLSWQKQQRKAVTARLRSSSFGEALHLGRATTEPWQSRAHRPPTNSPNSATRCAGGDPLSPGQWAARMGLLIGICALTCGWHYARMWIHYGNPLIGVWDPKLGIPWWQGDGYRTSTFYLQFGDVLFHPWSGGWRSFGDGIYATLWGDGMLSGAGDFIARPLWNFELMALGYWLALLPSLAVLAGGILTVIKFIQRPSAEWFLLLGFGFIVLGAMVYLSLVVPYYCTVKAFYGLPALIPFCVCGALGLDLLARRNTKLRSMVCIVFGVWAINTYASYWISRSSVVSTVRQAFRLGSKGQYLDATDVLKQRLRSDPKNADLQFTLAYFLTITGRVDEGVREAEKLVQDHPDDCRGHYVLALAFAKKEQADKAIAEFREAMVVAPGYHPSWEDFTSILIAPECPDEIVKVCRQALAMAPFSPGLRLALGSALLVQNQDAEGAEQLRYASLLDPKSLEKLADLAWKMATSPPPARRNGALAVKLAEQACTLTTDNQARRLAILAAVYAEAGRKVEAMSTAEKAESLALASGDSAGAMAARDLLQRIKDEWPDRKK